MATPTPDQGRQDVGVSTSEICFIDGEQGRLLYRGYDIHDLVAHSSFLEQQAHNRLIRPRAEYTGSRRATYVPIDRR